MTDAAHTSGPWFVETYDEGLQINLECGYVVANLIGTDAPFNAANGRLIAAAPELLEALEDLAGYEDPRGYEYDRSLEKAQAAIGKATGRGKTINRTVKLGQFVRDELGTLHGRFSGLGIGSTSLISEPVSDSEHLNLVADPLGAAYQVGVLIPKEKDGKQYYAGVLDSPIFPTPLDVLILPDEETPYVFNLVWHRP